MKCGAIITINGNRIKGVFYTEAGAAYITDAQGNNISWDAITDLDTKLDVYSARGKKSGKVLTEKKLASCRANARKPRKRNKG